jgi:hypothetical protein
LEKVANNGSASLDVILAGIHRPLVGGAHGAFGQQTPDLVRFLIIRALDCLPYLLLPLMVGTD